MLSGAVRKFLGEYETVSVIARHESGFKKILSETDYPKRLNSILLDYSDTDLLSEKNYFFNTNDDKLIVFTK